MTAISDGLPRLAFADAEAFAQWLVENPEARGAWLKFAKKGGPIDTLTKAAAIDCALCHGWIDGQLGSLNDDFYLTRFTPRKGGGRWSANNVRRAEALMAQGRMGARGLAEIVAAKADGRWAAAYPSANAMTTPPDFAAALQSSDCASEMFATLDGANRYAVLYRLHHAKPQARERRIAEMMAMLERGETFHPPRKARQAGPSKTPKRDRAGNSTPS